MSFKFKFPSTCKRLKTQFGERLAEMAEKTKIDGKERGIRICENEILSPLTECVGLRCKVRISGVCPPSTRDFFDIHTHPDMSPMSYADVSRTASVLLDKECVIRNKSLECAEGLRKLTIPPNFEKYNSFMDTIPLPMTAEKWEEFYPKYKQFLESLEVKFCQEEL